VEVLRDRPAQQLAVLLRARALARVQHQLRTAKQTLPDVRQPTRAAETLSHPPADLKARVGVLQALQQALQQAQVVRLADLKAGLQAAVQAVLKELRDAKYSKAVGAKPPLFIVF
jgi:hypothetical protein